MLQRQNSLTLLVSLILALLSLLNQTASADQAKQMIISSPNDPRHYEYFTLPNQLRILVISDPATDKAAAAMNIGIGSSSDPEAHPGLAHFLEHMLFLGTEKYPEAGEYQSFITTHGGSHNAFTAFEDTNYFFEIDSDYLAPALDRFAQFFIKPLFSSEFVEREKNAVHSEYQSKLRDDHRRQLYALKEVVNAEHPFARFATGSLDTLQDGERPIREVLIEFYQQHYSANLMTLVVLGQESTTELKRMVTERFAAVANTNKTRNRIDSPLFTPGTLPARLDIEPVKDKPELSLSFPIPPTQPHYAIKPASYIANLIGHEGEGSLLSLLKRKGWSNSLSAGLGINNLDHATFNISISLTPEGSAHTDEITAYAFHYIQTLRQQGVEAWRYQEQQQLAELDFRFQEAIQPINYVSSLAYNLQRYQPQDLLRGPYLMERFDPELIQHYLSYLTPENVLVTRVGKTLATDRTARWFMTPYALAKLDPADFGAPSKDREQLRLPTANPFIPEDLSLKMVQQDSDKPQPLLKEPGLSLWFKQDTRFNVPKANLFFSLQSPTANANVKHAALTYLFVEWLLEALNEYAYPARLAGLHYGLYKHTRGFTLQISGYNDKQSLLAERIAQLIGKPDIQPAQFELAKHNLLRRWKNSNQDRPFQQLMREMGPLLLQPYWSEEELIQALEPVTRAELQAFAPRLLQGLTIEALAVGNLTAQDARTIVTAVAKPLQQGKANAVAAPSVVRLTPQRHYRYKLPVEHNDAAIMLYLQGRDNSFANQARHLLLAHLIQAPFYHELRTRQQLGYIVFANSAPMLRTPGTVFIIQSPETTPAVLEQKIRQFLLDYEQTLQAMDADAFARAKEGLLSNLLEKDQRLSQLAHRWWRNIGLEYYGFDMRERLAQAVEQLGKEDLLTFYREQVIGPQAAQLTLYSPGKHPAMPVVDGIIEVRDSHRFKQEQPLMPW